jgi:hypothetical protein
VSETTIVENEQAIAEAPAAELALPAEEAVSEEAAAEEPAAEEAAEEPAAEEAAEEATLFEAAPISGTAELSAEQPPPVGGFGGSITDTQQIETLETAATVEAADEVSSELTREGEAATADQAIAESDAFELETAAEDVANQPIVEVTNRTLTAAQVALGSLLLVLVILLIVARRRLSRW